MSESVKAAIEDMKEILSAKLAEVAKLKQTINGMARAIGGEPLYADDEPELVATRKSTAIRPDQFFGRSPITAAREYLEKVGEPKPADEILSALTKGGFDFEAQDWKDEKARLRNLAISLSKNTQVFIRLPSGPFGLTKWYPELKRSKSRTSESPEKDKQRVAEPDLETEPETDSKDETPAA